MELGGRYLMKEWWTTLSLKWSAVNLTRQSHCTQIVISWKKAVPRGNDVSGCNNCQDVLPRHYELASIHTQRQQH